MEDVDPDAVKRALADLPALIDLSRWGIRRLQLVSLIANEQLISPDGWAYLSTRAIAQLWGMKSDRYLHQLLGAPRRDKTTGLLVGGDLWRTEWVVIRRPGSGTRPAAFRVNPNVEAWRKVAWWDTNPLIRRARLAPLLSALERGAEGSLAPRSSAEQRGGTRGASSAMHRGAKGSNRGVISAPHRGASGALLRDASRSYGQKPPVDKGLSSAPHRGASNSTPRGQSLYKGFREKEERETSLQVDEADVDTVARAVVSKVRRGGDNSARVADSKRQIIRAALGDVDVQVLLDAIEIAPENYRVPLLVDFLADVAAGRLVPGEGAPDRMTPEEARKKIAELEHQVSLYPEGDVPDWLYERLERCQHWAAEAVEVAG